jgi:hypothetical protein
MRALRANYSNSGKSPGDRRFSLPPTRFGLNLCVDVTGYRP